MIAAGALEVGDRWFLRGRTVATVHDARHFDGYAVLDYVTDGGRTGTTFLRGDLFVERAR
jgi:hypothetical protein